MNEMTRPAPAAGAPEALEARIDRLAEIAVRVGLNLRAGQEVLMTAPLDAVGFARRVTEHAYRAGASLVTVFYQDDAARLARFRLAPDAAFDVGAEWLHEGIARAYREGAARLAIAGDDPSLLSGEDPDRVARAARAASRASRPALEQIVGFRTNWTICSAATPGWARAVFPALDEADAVARLWEAILQAARVDAPDPVAAWREHNAALAARTAMLDARRFASLRFTGPGTDLTVGLAGGHVWRGGAETAGNGITCNPNIPTEEVFTTPDCRRVEGTVRATKPLAYQGTLIEGIEMRFEGGRAVEVRADRGGEVLQRVVATDPGASRLGEVALVPHGSPISRSGLLFRNTLYDENAASHIAIGQAYSSCIAGGESMDRAALAAVGANESLIHIDWMIGSDAIDVDGIGADGVAVPVMRRGEWV